MAEKKKKKSGCLIPILVVVALVAIFGSFGGNDDKQDVTGSASVSTSTAEPTKSSESTESAEPAEQQYSTEFDPDYKVTCTDQSITIDVSYDCPDGTLLQCALMTADVTEMYTDMLPVKDGKVSFAFDLDNTDTKTYASLLSLQFNADSLKQPDAAKAVYGEYGEKLMGENAESAVVEGHDDAKNGGLTMTINYPSDEAVWNQYTSGVISSTNGMITSILRPTETVYEIHFTNDWYLLTAEEKEYMANTLWSGIKTAAKNFFSEGTISLSIYAGDAKVAESSLFSGKMKMK